MNFQVGDCVTDRYGWFLTIVGITEDRINYIFCRHDYPLSLGSCFTQVWNDWFNDPDYKCRIVPKID